MDSDTYNDIQSGQVYEFQALKLKDSIGYVRIVGLPMGDNQKMFVRWPIKVRPNGSSICDITAEEICFPWSKELQVSLEMAS